MNYSRTLSLLSLTALAAVSLACGTPAAPPLSPSPSATPSEGAGAGPDGTLLKITAPAVVSPVQSIQLEDDTPELVIANSTPAFVDSLSLDYVFEVFDEQGTLVYRSAPIGAGPNGQTAHQVGTALPFNRGFSWRAYPVYDGHRGPATAAAEFRTYLPGPPGASCAHLGNELAIVQCRRAQFDDLNDASRVDFLKRVAYDLNRAQLEHRPYGVLIKSTGNNCHGYSCDIICSDSGGFQRQWDVLLDENWPLWSRITHAVSRPCEKVQ